MAGNEELARYHYQRGWAYFNQKEYDRALEHFDQAVNADPSFADAFNVRGGVHYMAGRYEAAIREFTKVIELDSGNGLAYSNRAVSLALLGRREAAEKDARVAILVLNGILQFDESFADGHGARGYANVVLGNLEEARADFERAERQGMPRDYIDQQLARFKKATANSGDRWVGTVASMLAGIRRWLRIRREVDR